MKKIGLMLLTLSLCLLPIKAFALDETDTDCVPQNDCCIKYNGTNDDSIVKCISPSDINGNTSSSDPQAVAPDEKDNPDQAVSSDDNNTPTGEVNPDEASDLAAYDTVKALAESSTNSDQNDNKGIILYSVGSGVIGMTIGTGLVYFLVKKH